MKPSANSLRSTKTSFACDLLALGERLGRLKGGASAQYLELYEQKATDVALWLYDMGRAKA